MCREDLWNSCVFKRVSSSETLRLTLGIGIPRVRDAAERLPASATAMITDIDSKRSMDRALSGK
jgi:hypothetical protein